MITQQSNITNYIETKGETAIPVLYPCHMPNTHIKPSAYKHLHPIHNSNLSNTTPAPPHTTQMQLSAYVAADPAQLLPTPHSPTVLVAAAAQY